MVSLFFLFLAGQLANVFKRMAFAIRNPSNPASSRMDFLIRNWDVLLYRVICAQAAFWLWVYYPDGLTKLLSTFGVTVNLTVPHVPVVALITGLSSDVLLDYLAAKIPALNRELPQVNGKAAAASK